MKQRSPVTAAVLSAFLPIYTLYWLEVTAKGMKKRGVKVPTLWLLFGPVLIAGVSFFSSAYSQGNDIFGIIATVAMLLTIPLFLIYIYRFSKAAHEATQGRASAGLMFILFIVLAPVSVYLIQERLNESATGAPSPDPQPHPFSGTVPPPQPTEVGMSAVPPATPATPYTPQTEMAPSFEQAPAEPTLATPPALTEPAPAPDEPIAPPPAGPTLPTA